MLAILTTWYRQGLVVGGLERGKLLTLFVSGPSERVQILPRLGITYHACFLTAGETRILIMLCSLLTEENLLLTTPYKLYLTMSPPLLPYFPKPMTYHPTPLLIEFA